MTKSRPLAPKGGNDLVYTPDYLAQAIVAHFNPRGLILEPCRGQGAFIRALENVGCQTDWCEIEHGRDFLTHDFGEKRFSWTLTNPPWAKIRPFLARSMQLSDNVVFLCLINAIFMKARLRDMEEAGFGIREIVCVDTPPKPWPQTGFQLGAIHLQHGHNGPIQFIFL